VVSDHPPTDAETSLLRLPTDVELERDTDDADALAPWLVELRVVGTSDVLQVTAGEGTVLGRADSGDEGHCDIDLAPYNALPLGVSRRHALIRIGKNRVTITDLGSSNGTRIDGSLLKPNQPYRIWDQDTLQLGNLRLQVHFVIQPLIDEKTSASDQGLAYRIQPFAQEETVLVADEDETTRQLIGALVRQAGFRVIRAGSMAEAAKAIGDKAPLILITEARLPDAGSDDLVSYLEHRFGVRPRVLVLTQPRGGGAAEPTETGFEVLNKPVAADALIELLKVLYSKATL
jgi:pSer/pThr/pTyr-binding forkhead associated (FHA) protein